jgi:hypothetical protein
MQYRLRTLLILALFVGVPLAITGIIGWIVADEAYKVMLEVSESREP